MMLASKVLTFVALAGAGGAIIYCLMVLGANELVGPVIAYEANPFIRRGEIVCLVFALPVVALTMLKVATHK